MARTSGIASSRRAFLKVTLEDVASRECVFAQEALVGSITSVCFRSVWSTRTKGIFELTSQHVAFQMLCVQVRLRAVRAWILPRGILLGYHGLGGESTVLVGSFRATRGTGKNASAALRTNDVCRRLLTLHHRCLLSHMAGMRQARETVHRAANAARGHGSDVGKADLGLSAGERSGGRRRVHHRLRHVVRLSER